MLVPVSLFQSPSPFSFVETTNLPQDPVTLSAAVSRMGFELVLNRGFESVDDKEQTFASLSTFVVLVWKLRIQLSTDQHQISPFYINTFS